MSRQRGIDEITQATRDYATAATGTGWLQDLWQDPGFTAFANNLARMGSDFQQFARQPEFRPPWAGGGNPLEAATNSLAQALGGVMPWGQPAAAQPAPYEPLWTDFDHPPPWMAQ